MAKTRSQLQILLLQAREDEETSLEEINEFVSFSRLDRDQFTALNMFASPNFAPNCVDGYDAVFVGGSSDASVLAPEKFTFVEDCKKLLSYCVDQSVPVFASCFGFQVVVVALGGTVILDQAGMEIGTFRMELTAAAKTDLLFHDLPEDFWAIAGHKERALTLPAGTVNLAATALCPYHALKIPGKPFYGFQFHPELTRADLTKRLTRYCDRYLEHDQALQEIISTLRDTPEANELINKFIERILLS